MQSSAAKKTAIFMLIALALLNASCTGTDDPATSDEVVAQSYLGVVGVPGNPSLAGSLSLTVNDSAVAGTLSLKSGALISMLGTYQAASHTVAVAGGGFQLTAMVSAGTLVGTGAHPSTKLPLGVVASLTPTTQTWTGTALSNAGQNCGASFQSRSQFQFLLESTNTSTAYTVLGQAVSDTDGTQAVFRGTAQLDGSGGGTTNFTVDPPNSYANGAGLLATTGWSGTYQGGSPSLCEKGTWSATRLK